MSQDVVIQCEDVGKKYCKSLKQSMFYGAIDIATNIVGVLPKDNDLRPSEFWAVNEINFELKNGESLGLIGHNGSGKTTLLKLLNGIFMPDKGRVKVKGKVGGLIHVGAGFHPMLSGRENIYVNGAILGLTKKEIDKNLDSIIDFADIGDFLDSPVKFYSSGMYVRLGFAVAVHCRPNILLIDEVLAVGDLKFQSKCLKFITQNILKNGCSVVFVSHSRYTVQDVCQKAIYLHKGQMKGYGQTVEVINQYLTDIKIEENLTLSNHRTLKNEGITKVEFLNNMNQSMDQFKSGESVKIRFYYNFPHKVNNPCVGITLLHDDPRFTLVSSSDHIFNLHSGYDGLNIPYLEGKGCFEVEIDCLYIPVGVYKYSLYLYTENKMNLIYKQENAGKVEILWTTSQPQRSLIELPHRWRHTQDVNPT